MTKPILVADPNQEFGILIRQTLEESGRYDVSLTSSGSEALRLAHDYTFELAIVDLALPDIDGLALIRQLRELQPDLAIIAIPKGDTLDPSLARHARVDGILSKPFYLPDLPDVVKQALSGRLGTGPLGPPKTQPSSEPAPAEATAPVASRQDTGLPSPWLSDPELAAQYLARLIEETSADGSMLIREGRLWASGGRLPVNQLQELTMQVAESWADEARRGAIARYIRLPGMAIDHMLYATEVNPEITLALVYNADTPFGKIRRQAQELARTLADVDPAAPIEAPPPQSTEPTSVEQDLLEEERPADWQSLDPDLIVEQASQLLDDELRTTERLAQSTPEVESEALPTAAPFEETVTAEAPTPETLPTDWIPEQESAAADRHLITQLAASEPVGGEPDVHVFPHQELIPTRTAHVDLPLDWLPMITQSRRHMLYLEEPPSAKGGTDSGQIQEEKAAPPPPPSADVAPDEPPGPAQPPQEMATPAAPPPPASPSPPAQQVENESSDISQPAAPDAPESAAGTSAEAPTTPAAGDQPSEPPKAKLVPPPDVTAASAGPASGGPERHLPDDGLGYFLVLVPRFPEHRLSGALTTHLGEWVRHLCVAWDWRADSVQVRDTALTICLTLSPDTAPATAAERLAEGLSSRVLEMYPHLGAGVPSGRFWASQYLLQAGPEPTTELIESFVEELRRAQGLKP